MGERPDDDDEESGVVDPFVGRGDVGWACCWTALAGSWRGEEVTMTGDSVVRAMGRCATKNRTATTISDCWGGGGQWGGRQQRCGGAPIDSAGPVRCSIVDDDEVDGDDGTKQQQHMAINDC